MNSIKVRTNIAGHDGWSLFETEEHISWDDNPKLRKNDGTWLEFHTFENDTKLCKEIRYKTGKGEWESILFHDVAYIINENGKTIETIRV